MTVIDNIVCRVTIENREAVDSLLESVELLVEAADDMPWRTDLREVIRLLEKATKGIDLKRLA